MKIISPSILACDFLNLENELNLLNNTDCEYLHLDVMDGHFVNNLTFGYQLISCIRTKTDKVLDVHLMISNPTRYLEEYINAGRDIITIHLEIEEDINNIIDIIKSNNKKVGIAIKPDTDLELLTPYLDKIDLVLVMSVNPGFGGQSFIESSTNRIKHLVKLREENNYNYVINVDGGVNNSTRDKVEDADILVAGSYVFNSDDYQERITSLR